MTIFFSQLGFAQGEWVFLGKQDFKWGYKTLYRISLYAPKGVHELEDIKKGLQEVKFELTWLTPNTKVEEVQEHFEELIKSQFKDPEAALFNDYTIKKMTKKLVATNRLDKWAFHYSPDSGTDVFINNKYTHKIIGSEVNRALYSAWLLENPMATAKLLNRLLKQG